MTIHDFDMARFVLGEEVTTVTAAGAAWSIRRHGGVDDYDTVTVVLTTAREAVLITNSRRAT